MGAKWNPVHPQCHVLPALDPQAALGLLGSPRLRLRRAQLLARQGAKKEKRRRFEWEGGLGVGVHVFFLLSVETGVFLFVCFFGVGGGVGGVVVEIISLFFLGGRWGLLCGLLSLLLFTVSFFCSFFFLGGGAGCSVVCRQCCYFLFFVLGGEGEVIRLVCWRSLVGTLRRFAAMRSFHLPLISPGGFKGIYISTIGIIVHFFQGTKKHREGRELGTRDSLQDSSSVSTACSEEARRCGPAR